MKVWLELTQQEGELLFEVVKEFTIERMKTVAMGIPKEDSKVEEVKGVAEPVKTEMSVSIEQIRAVLADKSQDGKQAKVKALITKYGANKLTDVDPAMYSDLLKEAEVL